MEDIKIFNSKFIAAISIIFIAAAVVIVAMTIGFVSIEAKRSGQNETENDCDNNDNDGFIKYNMSCLSAGTLRAA